MRGTSSGSRRVAGPRRGEVAGLAGVSVEYYTRLALLASWVATDYETPTQR